MDTTTVSKTPSSGPKTSIRLHLRASNLPKSIITQGYRQPDTLARVSLVTPHSGQHDDESDVASSVPSAPLFSHKGFGAESGEIPDDGGGSSNCSGKISRSKSQHDQISDETEIVYKNSNPRWAASFSAEYEYGSQLLIFVEIFAMRQIVGGKILTAKIGGELKMKKSEFKLLGRAVFDVQDVMGSKNRVKARRLPKGGVVYAQIEQQHSSGDIISTSLSSSSSSPTLSRSLDLPSYSTSNNRIFTLQLRASTLVHTHSIQNRLAPSTISKPDTYIEISRPGYLTTSSGTIRHFGPTSCSWIVVYRSPPVKESVLPMWDEAVIDLDSLYSTSTSSSSSDMQSTADLETFPLMITVLKVKKKKCKEIGSFETTVKSLVDAYKNSYDAAVKVTGYEGDDSYVMQQNESKGNEQKQVFFLRNSAAKGTSSGEITGEISVIVARVERSGEVWNRSQQFTTDDEAQNSEDMNDGVGEMIDADDVGSSISSVTMPSYPTIPFDPSRPRNARFSDYVSAGLDIDLCVAIDFTSSNGDPRVPGTLHYSRDGMMNDYEEAIESIGSTISKYSSSKEFPVWGFGAKYGGTVRHIFQCGRESAAAGIDGVLDSYRSVFETDFTMSGPTVMDSILRAAASRSKKFHKSSSSSSMKYCVLLILSDGMVSDLVSTQELVHLCRELPLSIVVVGIGRADFSEMHSWNDIKNIEERGRFTFVEFRKLQFDPDALSRKALEKVPHEVVDYFLARGILPS